jgi:hypothetical protein
MMKQILLIFAGLIKSMLVMISTPLVASYIGLNNPRSALIHDQRLYMED